MRGATRGEQQIVANNREERMRSFVVTLTASVMMAMTGPALAGEVYVIETS